MADLQRAGDKYNGVVLSLCVVISHSRALIGAFCIAKRQLLASVTYREERIELAKVRPDGCVILTRLVQSSWQCSGLLAAMIHGSSAEKRQLVDSTHLRCRSSPGFSGQPQFVSHFVIFYSLRFPTISVGIAVNGINNGVSIRAHQSSLVVSELCV